MVNENKIVKLAYRKRLTHLEEREKYFKGNDCKVREEQADYEITSQNSVNNEHDKIYKTLLTNQEDVAHVINQVLQLDKDKEIKPDELEKYKSSFITNQFQSKEADIVYKLKDKNIFFLIEHQSKVDYSMSYRIEDYQEEIIRSAIDLKQIRKKRYEKPEVISIVLYTGKTKWNVSKNIHQIKDERFQDINVQTYYLLDLHECDERKLLNSKHFIDKTILIEKTKDRKEFAGILEEIILHTKEKEQRKQLGAIMRIILKGKLSKKESELIKKMKGEEEEMLAVVKMLEEDTKRIREEGVKEGMEKMLAVVKMLEEDTKRIREEGVKEGMEKMLAVVKMLEEDNKKIREEGVKEGMRRIISYMLKSKIDINEIKELTGLTIEEIEQIKK